MNFMPKFYFSWLRARWKHNRDLLKDNPEHDQGIMEGMFVLNRIPGLVTIWSCEGHPNPEKKIPARGYIMIGVLNQNGLTELFKVYTQLTEAFGHHSHLVRLTTTVRGNLVKAGLNGKETWPVWLLGWPVFNDKQKECFAKVNESIQRVYQKE